MNGQIKQLSRTLQIEYAIFILLAVLFFLGYETGILAEGAYADDARMQYVWETVGILTTIVLVPLSLKLFSFILLKKVKESTLIVAVRLYRRWSEFRLLILTLVVLLNIFIYYSTLNNTGAMCALIGVAASFFCLPGEKKVREDLDLNDIEEK